VFSTEVHTGEGGYRQTPADSCLYSEHREAAENVCILIKQPIYCPCQIPEMPSHSAYSNVPAPTHIFIVQVKSANTQSYKQTDVENVKQS